MTEKTSPSNLNIILSLSLLVIVVLLIIFTITLLLLKIGTTQKGDIGEAGEPGICEDEGGNFFSFQGTGSISENSILINELERNQLLTFNDGKEHNLILANIVPGLTLSLQVINNSSLNIYGICLGGGNTGNIILSGNDNKSIYSGACNGRSLWTSTNGNELIVTDLVDFSYDMIFMENYIVSIQKNIILI